MDGKEFISQWREYFEDLLNPVLLVELFEGQHPLINMIQLILKKRKSSH